MLILKKRKKKIKKRKLISFLLFIVLIVLSVLWYKDKNITNIYVSGNNLLDEQTIIELAGIEDYPKVYQVSKNKIKDDLLTSPFIASVDVEKSLFGKIKIKVNEYETLCKDSINDKLILVNRETKEDKSFYYDKDILGIPTLTNQVIPDVNDKFIEALLKIDKSILTKISEITYDPNTLDDERFLLYMIDHNYVYVTLSKIESINTYNEIVPTLEGKKGILYLDSGNHFQIKK